MALTRNADRGPVSLVLLVHNETQVIERVVREFHLKVIAKVPGSEIIIAEDGSTDGTKEVLRALCREFPEVRLEERAERRGYVEAYRAAMALPRNDLILFCDAGGKHDPDDFWPMYEAIDGCDMVIGYKVKRQDPAFRIVLTKVFNFCVNRYFGLSYRDIDCPLRLIRKEAFDEVARVPWLQSSLINFEVTVRLVKMGYRVQEVPVKHFARRDGGSRGLPPRTIPRVVWQTLCNFPAIARTAAARPSRTPVASTSSNV
jgi:glycosyltransferase involved in cell wall biosynthesis